MQIVNIVITGYDSIIYRVRIDGTHTYNSRVHIDGIHRWYVATAVTIYQRSSVGIGGK
jgi:hypothetical protein